MSMESLELLKLGLNQDQIERVLIMYNLELKIAQEAQAVKYAEIKQKEKELELAWATENRLLAKSKVSPA